MGRIFKAQYWIRLSNGNIKQNNEIEFTFPEDITTASLYSEEKKNGRVSNIIGNLTGYSSHQIEIRKLEDLGNKSTEQRTAEYNSEKARKEQIKREIAQQKKDDADLDDYLDRIQNKYGSGKRKKEEDSFIGSIFSSEEKVDNRTPEQIEADRARVAEENRKFFESIKRNWKIILAGIIVVFIITGVMGYLNSQKVKEANEFNLKLEKIEDQIKLAITDGNRDKALELVDQLVHPLHEMWQSKDKFDALNGYPYYDEYWTKKREMYKEEILKKNVTTQSTESTQEQMQTQEAQSENRELSKTEETPIQQTTQKYYNGCGYSYESKEDCMTQCGAFNGGNCPEGPASGQIIKASKPVSEN